MKRVTDEEILSWLQSQSSTPSSNEASKFLMVHQSRVRNLAEIHGIEIATSPRENPDVYEVLIYEARDAIRLGFGLDNKLGELIAAICDIPKEQVVVMACGGTVNICLENIL